MKFPHLIMTITGIFEVWIIINLFLDFSENAHKYLTDNNLVNFIILSLMLIIIISLVSIVHIADKRQIYYLYRVSTIFCTILSAAWLLMFVNATLNEHFKILTPFLLYMSFIKFLIAWYLGDAAKESSIE